MLWASSLFSKAEAGEILESPLKEINHTNIRPLIIGDGAYPATSWLVKPYPHNVVRTNEKKQFNRKLSSARSVVERSFGILKARFHCLLKRLDHELNNIPNVIISCCVLHNICQITGEQFQDDNDISATI